MTWYDLRDEVATFLGDRATVLFAHAISTGTDCLICSTFFRRLLIDAGDDPDDPRLDEREALVVEFGRQLARDPHGVSDELFGRLSRAFLADQIVALTAFGGLMVATNLFNNALRVDLDEYLWAYREARRPERASPMSELRKRSGDLAGQVALSPARRTARGGPRRWRWRVKACTLSHSTLRGRSSIRATAWERVPSSIRLRASCRALGVECLPFAADVRDDAAVSAAVAAAVERFGRIDILFNNAGICAMAWRMN